MIQISWILLWYLFFGFMALGIISGWFIHLFFTKMNNYVQERKAPTTPPPIVKTFNAEPLLIHKKLVAMEDIASGSPVWISLKYGYVYRFTKVPSELLATSDFIGVAIEDIKKFDVVTVDKHGYISKANLKENPCYLALRCPMANDIYCAECESRSAGVK